MTESSYFQDIVSALEKALYYERGRGGYFRATMGGTDFIDREQIKGETSEEVIAPKNLHTPFRLTRPFTSPGKYPWTWT